MLITDAEIILNALDQYRRSRALMVNGYEEHLLHAKGGTLEMRQHRDDMQADLAKIEDLYECYRQEPDIVLENIASQIQKEWEIADTFPSYDDEKETLDDHRHAKIMGYEDTAPFNLLDPPEFGMETRNEFVDLLRHNNMNIIEVSSTRILFEDPNTESKLVLIPCQQEPS